MTSVTSLPGRPGATAKMSHREVLQALSGLMLGLFVSILASTIVSNALPRIIADLGGSTTTDGGGTAAVPDLTTLPAPVRAIVADIYGQATAELFLVGAPIAALAVIAVLFIKEKPLHTLSGDERRAQEEAATGVPLH